MALCLLVFSATMAIHLGEQGGSLSMLYGRLFILGTNDIKLMYK